jgi:hypothetical protein
VPLEINGIKSVQMMTHPATSDSSLLRKLSEGALYTILTAAVQFLIFYLLTLIGRTVRGIEYKILWSLKVHWGQSGRRQ